MEDNKYTINNNPYVLLGIPYGSSSASANKALAKKSISYRNEGKDISLLTSAVAKISKIESGTLDKETYFAIPTSSDILSPKIPGLAEYLIKEKDVLEEAPDFMSEYTLINRSSHNSNAPIAQSRNKWGDSSWEEKNDDKIIAYLENREWAPWFAISSVVFIILLIVTNQS